MDYVQHAFYDTSDWDIDNFYSSLTTSAQGQYEALQTGRKTVVVLLTSVRTPIL